MSTTLIEIENDWPLGPCYELNGDGRPEVWVTPLGEDAPVQCVRPILTQEEWETDWLVAIDRFIPLRKIGLGGSMRDVISMLGGIEIIPDRDRAVAEVERCLSQLRAALDALDALDGQEGAP